MEEKELQNKIDSLASPITRASHYEEDQPRVFDYDQVPAKLIAFYFPQFHPFEENDRIWGKGFTEWTNTTKCKPQFVGHRQPKLAGELGFYDTRLKHTLKRQIELAKGHGVYGFCFHHYWFSGKPVMRAPYDLMMANPDLDIPFCLHWANEPWTARWDGMQEKGGVLLAQNHNPEDDIAFIKDIEPALRDRRYIKVNGRPLFVVYRPHLFPDIKASVKRWNDYLNSVGLPSLYLCHLQQCFDAPFDPNTINFDAAIEYPPHHLETSHITDMFDFYGKPECTVYNYKKLVDVALNRKQEPYEWFRGIMVGWDNTPRRRNGAVYVNDTPCEYGRYLEGIINQAKQHPDKDKRLVFINSWNEHAEGCYLDPDFDRGYAMLNETARRL